MAIKHLGNKSNMDAPAPADIKEREIAINLIEPALYTKDHTGTVIKVAAPERGGLLYDPVRNYKLGDIVSTGAVPAVYYTAMQDNTGMAPAGGLPDWEEYGTDYHNAVIGGVPGDDLKHYPSLGQEYPDCTNETIGAVWYITGLGVTGVTPNLYEFTGVGGSLKGLSVRDDDKIIWVAENAGPIGTGSESWLWAPFPRINYEQGGKLWITDVNYVVGDLVSHNGEDYTCVDDVTAAFENPLDPTYWKKLYGNEIWDSGKTYDDGDIVTDPSGGDYIVPPGTPAFSGGGNPSLPSSPWVPVTSNRERGGLHYNSTYFYVEGDIVTGPDGKVYRSLVNTPTSLQIPGSDSAIWKAVGGLSLWENTVTYDEGDVVFWDDDLYIAPVGGVPAGIQPPNPPWIKTTRGGQLWYGNISYIVGDIASLGGDAYVALTDNFNSNPSANPADWRKLAPLNSPAFTGDPTVPTPPANDNDTTIPNTLWVQNLIATLGTIYVKVIGDTMTGILNMGGNRVENVGNPNSNDDAVNRGYADSRYVNVGGDTMSGNLTIPNATAGGHAMNRNTSDGRYINAGGDTMGGTLNMNNKALTNIACSNTTTNAINRNCYAQTTRGGTLKARLNGTDLYLSNDGSNP